MVKISAQKAVILGWSLVVLSVLCGACGYELDIYLDKTRPRVMDIAAGRTYSLNNHGSIVYLTRGEHMALISLQCAAAGLFVIAWSLRYYVRRANAESQKN
jgi:hypothetical protein